jgi:hypothetical protein
MDPLREKTNMGQRLLNLAVLVCLSATAPAWGREWTDVTGRFTVEAELVAFSAETAVLKKKEGGELVAVSIERLSDDDREYLQSTKAHEDAHGEDKQLWTLRNGLQVPGRVVAYGRKEVTLQRRRSRIYVNDRQFENLPEIYQRMIPKVVGHFEEQEIEDRAGLQQWILRQRGQPRTFVCEGVILELENGDEYAVPFFFFSDKDQEFLRPGWDQWLAAHEKQEEKADHDLYVRALAKEYHRDRQVDRQIKMMQLELLAVNAGVVDLWEVALLPQPGSRVPGRFVIVPARNSLQASQAALMKFPGHVVGPIRRVN